mgnify:FL=1
MSDLTIYDHLYSAEVEFNKIALVEKHVRWEEECEFAKQAIVRNERLQQCIPWTVQDAIKNVASIGLTLNPALGLAYLVPEYSKGLKGQECLLRISSKGLVRLATDCGVIRLAKAEIVKELDEFAYKGIFELPEHKMNPFQDRGKTIGVYCVAKLTTGEFMTDVMSMEDIKKCESAAKIKDVWANWFEEMAKKSMIKRAQKQWPKSKESERLERAITYDNEHEGAEFNQAEQPKAQEALPQPKRALSELGLMDAINKIKNGELTKERLFARIELSEDQIKTINRELPTLPEHADDWSNQ